MNNTVNKLILDRESYEKLPKKLRFADPVFITSGIYILRDNRIVFSSFDHSILRRFCLNPERKSCGFRNIRICVDGAFKGSTPFFYFGNCKCILFNSFEGLEVFS